MAGVELKWYKLIMKVHFLLWTLGPKIINFEDLERFCTGVTYNSTCDATCIALRKKILPKTANVLNQYGGILCGFRNSRIFTVAHVLSIDDKRTTQRCRIWKILLFQPIIATEGKCVPSNTECIFRGASTSSFEASRRCNDS